MFISESGYNNKPNDYKGVFQNLGEHESMEHLVGNRSLLSMGRNGGATLFIEGASLIILDDGVEEKLQAELDKVWRASANRIMEIKQKSKKNNSYYVLYHCGQKNEYVIHTVCANEEVSGLFDGRYMQSSYEYALKQWVEL